MNRIHITLNPATGKLPVGKSKFLGTPDTWDDFEWPAAVDEDGNEYDQEFFCQINCAEAAPFDKDGLLPKTGMLYFFYDLEDNPYRGDAAVIYYNGDMDKLEHCVVTEDDDEVESYQEQSIEFECVQYTGYAPEGEDSHFLLGEPSDSEQLGLGTAPDAEDQLLLQIDEFETDDFNIFFGDTGNLCFFIKKADLAKKDFSKAWFIVCTY